MYSRSRVFAAACIGMLLFGVVMISLGSVLPYVIEKFQLSGASTGILASILPIGILFGSLVFGPIADRFGYKLLLIGGGILTFIGMEGIALSSELLLLQFSIFCIGFGGGLLNGSTNALVADISEGNQSADLSLLGVFFGIGALGMPLILGFLNAYLSFEAVVELIGAAIVLPLIYFMIVKFPAPKNAQGFPLAESIGLIKDPILIALGMVLFFQSGLEGLVNNWTTTFLQDAKGFTAEKSLFTLSLFVLGLIATRIVLGKVLRLVPSYVIMIASSVLMILGTFVLSRSGSELVIIPAFVTIGIGFAAGFPIILGYVGSIYSQLSGTAFSIVITIALIGNVLSNYFMGAISETYGVDILPTMILIFGTLMLVLFILLLKKLSHRTSI